MALSNGTFPMQQKKYRWEIDPKTNEVVRVPTKKMHYQAFDDFKKVLELGAERSGLGLSRKEKARLKSRRAEMRARRRRSSTDSESSTAHLTPIERTRRRRQRLKRKVTTELRKQENTRRLMQAFPPVFHEQCDQFSGELKTLGGRFRDATKECATLAEKVARTKARVAAKEDEYKLIVKRRNRLMFERLAKKAKRVLARRKRVAERSERMEAEERDRSRSRTRNGRFAEADDEMTEDEILEQLAQNEAHASMALLLNDYLNAAAPKTKFGRQAKTHIEHKLHIGDVVNSFLEENSVVTGAAEDIIQTGIAEFKRSNIQLLGGKIGEQSAFDKEFGTEFDEDEFVGYTDEDIADEPADRQTRYFAWKRSQQKQKELELAENLLALQMEADKASASCSWMAPEEAESEDEMEDIFSVLADF